MKRNIFFLFFMSLLFVLTFFYDVPNVYAGDDDDFQLSEGVSEAEVIDMHKKMDSVLHLDNGWLYQDVIRSIGWGILKILVWIVNYIEDGVNGILQWNDFYSSSGVGKLMTQLTPFVIGLFLIALIYLGFQFMTNKIDKREEVLMNVLMAFSLIFLVPALMPYMDKVLKVGVSQLEGEENLKLSESLIKQNVADVKYYVNSGFAFNQLGLPIDKSVGKGEKRGSSNYEKANKVLGTQLSITEKLDIQNDKFAWLSTGYKAELKRNNKLGHDFLMTRTVYEGDGNKVRLKALADNKIPTTTLGQESYYRYHINWGTLIFSFAVIGIALAITVIKMARVIFDLGFHAIFGMFVAATDLTGGQRTKKIVTEIVSSFAVLFVMVLILKLFTLYVNWVTGLSSTVGGVIMVLMLIAGAWALIDAPDIVQRLLGIDAGLRSGWQAMMGAYAGAKTIGAGLKGVEKVAVGAGKMAKGGVAFGKGLAGAAPNKASASHVKPMPNAGGFNGPSVNATDALGSVRGMPQDLESKGGVGGATEEAMMPSDSSTIQETPQGYESGNKQNANETKAHNPSMPTQMNKVSGSSKIQPNDNPYQGYGLLSGSRAGQSTADLQARAYNTGASTRAGLGVVGGGMGRLAMGGARFMASPIRSSRNIAGTTAGRVMNAASTVGRNVKSMPSRVGAAAGNFVSRVNTPIGSANSSVSTVAGAASHATTASTSSSMASSVVGQTHPSMTSSASVGSATMPAQGPRNVMSVSQAMPQQVTGVPSVSRAVTSQAAQRIQSSGSTGSVASASSPSASQSGGVRTVGSVAMPTQGSRNVMSGSQAMPQQMATTPSVSRAVTNQAAQQVQGVIQSHGSGGSVVGSPSVPQSGGIRTVGSTTMPTQGSRNIMSGSQLTSQHVTPTSSSSNVAANQPSQPTQVTRGTEKTVNATTKGQNRTLRSENTINNKK